MNTQLRRGHRGRDRIQRGIGFRAIGTAGCAMSGRPPPPLPPSASEATRTRLTALKNGSLLRRNSFRGGMPQYPEPLQRDHALAAAH
jgi:hypothetical protein